MKKSLHQLIIDKATHGVLLLSNLKPNSKEVAQRLIAEGRLIKSACQKGYILNEVRK